MVDGDVEVIDNLGRVGIVDHCCDLSILERARALGGGTVENGLGACVQVGGHVLRPLFGLLDFDHVLEEQLLELVC